MYTTVRGAVMKSVNSMLDNPLSKYELGDVKVIQSIADDLLKSIQGKCPDSREKSLAITKLEESVMWAVKSIIVNR